MKKPLAFVVFFALCILSHLSWLTMALCGGSPDVVVGIIVAAFLFGIFAVLEAPIW